MKVTKLLTGGVLVIMSIVVVLQFKFDSFIQALLGYADLGATASILLAIALLVAGAIYIICHSSTSIVPPIISFIILLLGGIMGIFNATRFPGLMLWSWAAIAIGLIMAIITIIMDYFFEPAVDQYGNSHSNSYYDNNYPSPNNFHSNNYPNQRSNMIPPVAPPNNQAQAYNNNYSNSYPNNQNNQNSLNAANNSYNKYSPNYNNYQDSAAANEQQPSVPPQNNYQSPNQTSDNYYPPQPPVVPNQPNYAPNPNYESNVSSSQEPNVGNNNSSSSNNYDNPLYPPQNQIPAAPNSSQTVPPKTSRPPKTYKRQFKTRDRRR